MVIGLTGRICSGKNYIGRLLAQRGLEVWDLDRVAEKIRENKRTEVMNLLGTTDKEDISEIVFNNPDKLAALENIIYPELKKQILEFPYDLVINGALLKTAGFDSLCSLVIYVDVPQKERQRRAGSYRGMSEDNFLMRDNAQDNSDPKVTKYACPVVTIENFDKTDEQLIADLDRILSHLPKS